MVGTNRNCYYVAMRISIVDDHPIMLKAIAGTVAFICRECVVESFVDLESFLAARETAPDPDMLLLDLILPGYQGVESVLRCRASCPDVPIVVFSGITEPSTVMAALDAGAMSVIPKTASSDDLLRAVSIVLGGGYYVPQETFGGREVGPDSADGAVPNLGRGSNGKAMEGLTERQQHVLRLMLRGAPNKRIGAELQLSENTVKSHVSAILRSLGVRNRTEAVLAAHRLNLSHQLGVPVAH